MKNTKFEEEVWLFNFALERIDGKNINQSEADEWFDAVCDLAAERGMQIGGGFRAPKPEDSAPFPLRDEDDD